MNRIMLAAALALLLAAAHGAHAEDPPAEMTFELTHVSGSVYMISGVGGNVGFSSGPDGILLVDTNYDQFYEKIEAILAEFDTDAIKYVINTHYHGDHTGNNHMFLGEVPVIAHENARAYMASTREKDDQVVTVEPKERWPDVTYSGCMTIYFNGEAVQLTHADNVHTNGDTEVRFPKSKVYLMGDNWFSGMFPYIDLPAGGNVENLITHIAHLIETLPPDIKIIPGHGPLSTLDDLKKHHAMMRETTDIVRAKMKQGKTLKEIQQEGLPEEWAAWSWRFITTERWIEIVFNSYAGEE